MVYNQSLCTAGFVAFAAAFVVCTPLPEVGDAETLTRHRCVVSLDAYRKVPATTPNWETVIDALLSKVD
jgi:hypothetical protein